MSTTNNKAIYWRFLNEVFNEGRFDRITDLLSKDYVNHDAPPGVSSGPDGVRAIAGMFRSAFPDLHIEIEDQVSEGDKVSSRTKMTGTHKGAIFGIPPTGRKMQVPGQTMVCIQNGLITDSWVRNDGLILMTQLGATFAATAPVYSSITPGAAEGDLQTVEEDLEMESRR